MIAWLGTGLLGGNFVRALRKRGEPVQVWNRTAARAQALREVGATAFDTPAEAVRGAERVHVCLSDDAAVDAALAAAAPGLSAGAVIVDHSTTSPEGAVKRAADWAKRGFAFQNAPVFMAPVNALEGTGVILASGEKALFDRLEPALSPMTGKVVYLGPDTARATQFKLMGNLLFLAFGAASADMFRLGKAYGIAPEEAAGILDWLQPGATFAPRMRRVLAADFYNPTWVLTMARKDAGLMAAGAAPSQLTVISALIKDMDALIAQGHGADDWLVVAKDVFEDAEG